MKNQNNQNTESIAVTIRNAQNQEFLMWFEPSNTIIQTYNCLSTRKELLQPIFIVVQQGQSNRIALPATFEVEIILVNHANQISNIQQYTLDQQYDLKELTVNQDKYVIIAEPGFAKRFNLVVANSKIAITKKHNFILEQGIEPILNFDQLASEDVLKAILKEQFGIGLRSQFPSYYVWYNDLLFLVGVKGFPGFSASAPISKLTIELIEKLQLRAINFTLREPVYQRHFMNRTDTITKEATWWGMENRRKFVQTNHLENNSIIN